MTWAPFQGSRTAGWAIALLFVAPAVAVAQVQQAYYQPRGASTHRAQFANFLRGGSDVWMDAHGDPVVVPASYCGEACGPMGCYGGGGCYGGCGPMGPGGGCACCAPGNGPYPYGPPPGNTMAQPPGGWSGEYSPYMQPCEEECGRGHWLGDCCLLGGGGLFRPVDQCGPHFFDFSAEAVYWKKDRAADPRVIFATIGVTNVSEGFDPALALTTDNLDLDYEPGMRLTARHDLGALSFLEIAYSGLYEWGAVSQIEGDANIFTGFSDFGINPPNGAGLDATEQANLARVELRHELHNAEISVRRYWIGFNPRVTGTLLAGFRYTRLTDELSLRTIGNAGNAFIPYRTENDLVGFQGGGDVWVTVRQGCRIGAMGKAGIYNNRMESTDNVYASTRADVLFEQVKGDRVAFIGEGGVSVVCDLLPSWSFRAGYDVLFINTVALAANNFDFDNEIFLGGTRTPVLREESSALYHGANIGFEHVW